MQDTRAIQVAAITLFFIQLGKVRHREDKRLIRSSGSAMYPWGDSSHSVLVWLGWPHLWF